MKETRRSSIKKIGTGLIALPTLGSLPSLLSSCASNTETEDSSASNQEGEAQEQEQSPSTTWSFDISLAQWSLHKGFWGEETLKLGWEGIGKLLYSDPDKLLQGSLKPIDFPSIAKNQFGISAIELVNTFYFSKASDEAFWQDYKAKCDELGVSCQLIMCDAEGNLGDTDEQARVKAVENHYKWINAAKILGCHSIRVNAAGEGTAEEVKAAAIDGLGKLTEYGEENNINVIVENHGGYSSDGQWLSDVIKQVNSSFCGTLPDFGNFCIERNEDGCANEYDRYQGMKDLMPFAKGVSAKSHEFDEEGNEKNTDFAKMIEIVKESGFEGFIGIEYEGSALSEEEGIKVTKALLEKNKEALG